MKGGQERRLIVPGTKTTSRWLNVKWLLCPTSQMYSSHLTTDQNERKLLYRSPQLWPGAGRNRWNNFVCVWSDISMHRMALGCIRNHSCNSVSVNKCISYPSKYTSQQQNYTIIPPARESWCHCVCFFLLQIIFKGDDQPPKGCTKVSSLDVQKFFTS